MSASSTARSKRMSLALPLAVPWVAALVAAWAYMVAGAIAEPQRAAVARARAVADLVDAYRVHVTSLGRIYLPQERQVAGATIQEVAVSAASAHEDVQPLAVASLDPFMAVREFCAAAVAGGAAESMRLASDNPLNPANAASAFEHSALAELRQSAQAEVLRTDSGKVRLARALRADAACLQCHGDAAVVSRLRATYGEADLPAKGRAAGLAYTPGAVVGLTSVEVAIVPAALLSPNRVAQAMAAMGLVMAGWLSTWLLVRVPLGRRVRYASSLASGELDAIIGLAPQREAMTAEFDQLDRALERLHKGAFSASEILSTLKNDEPLSLAH